VSEHRAARLDDVPAGQVLQVDVAGTPIVLARVGEGVYACGTTCTHSGGPLGEGKLSGAKLTCPYHGWQFDVRTGRCLFPQRGGPVATYRTRIDGGDVWVEVP
jgi:nitrite reductase/ring-hydroxylating ferredoxin subunit